MTTRLLTIPCFLLMFGSLVSHAGAGAVPQGYDRGIRPEPEAGPTRVTVGIFVIDVIEIDDIRQSFTASLYFDVKYRDPRLADPSAPTVRSFGLDEIWWPDLGLVNRRKIDFLFPHALDVDPEGTVHYRQRAYGDFSARLDLRRFPFDSQQLPIEVVSYTMGPGEVELVVDRENSGRLDALSLAGWSITTAGVDVLPERTAELGLEQLVFHITVDRNVPFYRWSILVPLCLIVFMAWCVFWIDPQDLPSQIGLSTASVFAMIAFRFSLRALLPKIDYMTYLDEFVLAATVMVFSALGQAILTGRLAKTGHEALAHRIDIWSRSVYLIVFVGLAAGTLRFHF